jgi:hypothetical protein
VKLLNRTPIPDDILETLLVKAGRAVGAKTTNTVVQVNRCIHGTSGIAYNCTWVRWGASKRRLKCDGAFRITLPLPAGPKARTWYHLLDPLDAAVRFFEVARHEWGHIRDYQNPNRTWSIPTRRRLPHDRRPVEIRADNYVFDADEHKHGAEWAIEEIVALAVELEKRYVTH